MFLRHLSRIRRTITFRLILWYSTFFIVSTSFLFIIAYGLLSSSVRQKDREEIHQKLGEYAAQYRAGGIEALKNEVELGGRSAKEGPFFVRVAAPQNTTLFLDAPEQWKDFDLAQLGSSPSKENEEPTRLPTREGTKALEIETTLLGDGNLPQEVKAQRSKKLSWRVFARFSWAS